MEPLTEREIRASFVNCSKGDAKRLSIPTDLADRPWDDLDFLGWSDPGAAGRAYLVIPEERGPAGIALRYETGGPRRSQMCTICSTTHTNGGVVLMTARKAGEAGRRGNSTGTYMCDDLACSLYARRKKTPALGRAYRDDFDAEYRIEQIRENITAFLTRVRG
ncbi:FBP domain-containing protein [Nocardia sienata]|uniref:FBP domain-containing protein n=1 Tax=Nocardia sienata TaxID=248552 RepID=UPI0007A559F2|nr:FBP domain-containing protein [Nocardia sienata]